MPGRFFKTAYQLVVLSEDEPPARDIDLESLAEGISTGPWSGDMTRVSVTELSPQEAAAALIAQGSAPEFLGLDADGRDLDEEPGAGEEP